MNRYFHIVNEVYLTVSLARRGFKHTEHNYSLAGDGNKSWRDRGLRAGTLRW